MITECPTGSMRWPAESFAAAANYDSTLARILDPENLPSPPAIAIQVVNAAAHPNCVPADITAMLTQDPALCAKLLRAVNSCLYGLSSPVSSVSRAVAILGLNTIRSLALGLSLSAMRTRSPDSDYLKEFWISAVADGIFARELAIRMHRPAPEDDLIAGLLKDLGTILLRRAFPHRWDSHLSNQEDRAEFDPCGLESEAFGISHAEVSAAVLKQWNLPAEIVEPIRYHHRPDLMPECSRAMQRRAELLSFVSDLTRLDDIVNHPARLEKLLATARIQFGLEGAGLVEFLKQVAPKIEAFTKLLDQDVGRPIDYAAILASGTEELIRLTVENSRERLSGGLPVSATHRTPPPGATQQMPRSRKSDLPAYREEFLEALPSTGCSLGEYELQKQIGRGAMGVVYKAFEPTLQRFVAVKMLVPSLAACKTSRLRFLREARVAASIQHENVVSIHSVGEERGAPYMAMEYVLGRCLESQVEDEGPMPIPMLTSLMGQLTRGLAAAHLKNIIHRDIKPANILIEGETNRVKITDFGLARVSGETNLTQVGTLVGTPLYMAPEIIEGRPAGSASDLFSLGGLLYYAATGRPPFTGQNIAAVFRGVTQYEPVSPRRLRPELPLRLEIVILRLLEKDPSRRYENAQELLGELASESDLT